MTQDQKNRASALNLWHNTMNWKERANLLFHYYPGRISLTGREIQIIMEKEIENPIPKSNTLYNKSINSFSEDDLIKELETLKDPKMWKAAGLGGQDMYAGMPPAIRQIDYIISKLKR